MSTDRPMKPVLVLQNMRGDGPAYLATWLAEQGEAMDLRSTPAGDAFPADLRGHSALAVLGGEMSANDPLPSLRQAESLIRQAMDAGIPVIGHCLGGQLMARALGARVGASPRPEIGWQRIDAAPAAAGWFGEGDAFHVMHWHGESFELPPGAVPLARNDACPHQAFAIGPHLAMQFHVEVDAEKLARWSASTDPLYLAWQQAHPATVHDGARLRSDGARFLAAQQRMAGHAYRRWLAARA